MSTAISVPSGRLLRRSTATEVYDFWYFRGPGTNLLTETNYTGTSMLVPPGNPTTTTSADSHFLNQETHSNTASLAWDVTVPRTHLSRISISKPDDCA